MSIFKAIGGLFNNDGAIKAASAVGKFIDEQQLTEEEAGNQKLELVKTQVELMGSLKHFKKAQRAIGVVVAFTMVIGSISLFTAAWIEVFSDIEAIDTMLKVIDKPFIYYPVGAFVTLYTGGGAIESWTKKR